MRLKGKLSCILALCLCGCMLAGCGGKKEDVSSEETTEIVENDDCIVTFDDGDYEFELPVKAYGEEFTLPENSNPNPPEGEFCGWLGMDQLYQPGDTAVAEEFMTFNALRSDPNMGGVVAFDPVRGGYATAFSEEEIQLDSPYNYYYDSGEYNEFFDYWEDEDGNTYEDGTSFNVEKGKILFLNSVYSTDYSKAYKVDVYYNTGEDLDQEYHCYIKKGEFLPLGLSIEPAGCTFDGWYDAAEGGNRLAGADEEYTPKSDIAIYGHWTKE